MRRNRIIWLLVWILSVVGISFFGGAVSYGFFIVATITPVISLLYLVYVLFFYRIYQKIETKGLVVNSTVPFFFTLVNEYPLSFAGIRVKFFSDFSDIIGLDDSIEYELGSKEGVTRETGLVCKYRGEYEVGIKTVIIQDYLRLFKFSFNNPETLKVQVKPELVHLDSLSSFEDESVAKLSAAGDTEPDVLTGKYVPGDDIRLINWSQAAKNGELTVRKRIGEAQQNVAVIVDTCRYDKLPEHFIPNENKVLETALALSLYLAKKGIPVLEFHLASGISAFGLSSMVKFDEFYNVMSEVRFSENRSQKALFSEMAACHGTEHSRAVFMVLQRWSEAADRMCMMLELINTPVTVYLIGNRDETEKAAEARQYRNVHFVGISADDDLRRCL